MLDKYKVNVPPGKSGVWSIEHFNVSEEQASLERMRSLFSSDHGRGVPAGKYTALRYNGFLIMSDTPDEMRDHLIAIDNATGNVLINGLGLGMVLKACLEKDLVTHVTVIEKSLDVLQLVSEHYRGKYGERVTFICADAFEYKPPANTHYDMVWHDIWPEISSENLPGMHKLHRKYGRRTDWQGSWCRGLCEKRAKENKRCQFSYA